MLVHISRVWDLDGNESITLRLRSPGISVCWHPEEIFKVCSSVGFRYMYVWASETLGLSVLYSNSAAYSQVKALNCKPVDFCFRPCSHHHWPCLDMLGRSQQLTGKKMLDWCIHWMFPLLKPCLTSAWASVFIKRMHCCMLSSPCTILLLE